MLLLISQSHFPVNWQVAFLLQCSVADPHCIHETTRLLKPAPFSFLAQGPSIFGMSFLILANTFAIFSAVVFAFLDVHIHFHISGYLVVTYCHSNTTYSSTSDQKISPNLLKSNFQFALAQPCHNITDGSSCHSLNLLDNV